MKRRNVFLALIILCIQLVHAQNPTYEARLMNDAFPAANQYEFDIFIKRTGTTAFEMCTFQVGLNFPLSVANGGTLSTTYIVGTSQMSTAQVPSNPNVATVINSTIVMFKIAGKYQTPGSGTTMVADTGYGNRLGRFRIQTTATSLAQPMNVVWNFNGTTPYYATKVQAGVSGLPVDITTAANHINLLTSAVTITWQHTLKVTDATTGTQDLTYGAAPSATNGIDASLGEVALGSVPAAGTFDARFVLPVTPSASSLKDFRADSLRIGTYTVSFQPGAGGYPFTFKWNKTVLPAGFFTLRDSAGTFSVNMKNDTQYVLTNTAVKSVWVVYSKDYCTSVNAAWNWNIISVPLTAVSMVGSVVYPHVTSSFYGYSSASGYATASTLETGKGYFAKFDTSRTVSVCGTAIAVTTIPIVAGWNLIGMYDKNVTTSTVTTTPAGLVNSSWFGFTYPDGYSNPTTLSAGKGYWVRSTGAGVLNVVGTLAKNGPAFIEGTVKPEWTKIILRDATGAQKVLYLTKESFGADQFDLPPVPPAGVFDVRFGSDKYVETLGAAQEIRLSSLQFPVTMKVEGSDLQFSDKATGKLFNQTVRSGQQITMNNPAISILTLNGANVPVEFSLAQNYPNPFNPSTQIRYQLPEAAQVSLKLFDVLGREVATLLSERQESGYYTFELSSAKYHLASGMYIYELKADKFTSVKKMMLLK